MKIKEIQDSIKILKSLLKEVEAGQTVDSPISGLGKKHYTPDSFDQLINDKVYLEKTKKLFKNEKNKIISEVKSWDKLTLHGFISDNPDPKLYDINVEFEGDGGVKNSIDNLIKDQKVKNNLGTIRDFTNLKPFLESNNTVITPEMYVSILTTLSKKTDTDLIVKFIESVSSKIDSDKDFKNAAVQMANFLKDVDKN